MLWVDVLFSGFVSKVVNDVVDISKIKIEKEINEKNLKCRNLESQIYNLIVDVLNDISSNQYKNDQEIIYDAAEKLLNDFKNNNIKNMKYLLQDICSCTYTEFKMLLCKKLIGDDYIELYRAISLAQHERESIDALEIKEKIDEVDWKLEDIIKNGKECDFIQNKRKITSRTQEYIQKWNDNMFLNNFNERDHNAGKNVSLKNVYKEFHLPLFKWRERDEKDNDLKKLLDEFLFKNTEKSMLVIFGHPGIGKSTLITWIIAHYIGNINDILVYQFASDLL